MPIIPQLLCPDPEEVKRQFVAVFGFEASGDLLHFGTQTICLTKGSPAGHGCIDHIALAVPDIQAAAARVIARGGQVDLAVTPNGVATIPEFWSSGVHYLFLAGPSGARIELITNIGAPHGPGHDHIGIPCTDLAATRAFLLEQGAQPMAEFTLHRDDGETPVSFLTLHGSVLELYQPTLRPQFQAPGLWQRLLISGIVPATGPDGLTLAPA